MLTAKKFLTLGAFALVGVIVLFLFTLFGGNGGEPAESTGSGTEGTEGTEGVSIATEQPSSPFLPQEVIKITCAKYSSLPPDVVPCEQAYEFAIKNFGAGTEGLWLMYEAQDGSLKQLAGSEPEINSVIAAGVKRLMWYAVSETKPFTDAGANTTSSVKYVLLDAKDLTVVKETP